MKPSHLLSIALAVLAPSVVACGAEEQEGEGAQFPPMPGGEPTAAAPLSAPGEAPIPIEVPPPRPPAPPAEAAEQPPQPIVPGETTEEEYNSRPADVAAVADSEDEYSDSDPSALTDFRGALDPYGSWQDDPNYGTVWTPSPSVVGDDFAPYVSGGHWTYDDYDNWSWVSDYDWGWAPFHYGRWAYLGTRWGWIPGRRYAGAWVSWRTGYDGYDYLGWAPLPPAWGWRGGLPLRARVRPGRAVCLLRDAPNLQRWARLASGERRASRGRRAAHARLRFPVRWRGQRRSCRGEPDCRAAPFVGRRSRERGRAPAQERPRDDARPAVCAPLHRPGVRRAHVAATLRAARRQKPQRADRARAAIPRNRSGPVSLSFALSRYLSRVRERAALWVCLFVGPALVPLRGALRVALRRSATGRRTAGRTGSTGRTAAA